MNSYERAVIEAACAYVSGSGTDHLRDQLYARVKALELYECAQAAAGITQVSWARVTEGDQLRGKSGKFFPVIATKREWRMGRPTGKFLITVQLTPDRPHVITRPNEAEPEATVKRGDAGAVVDTFVNVFESGEI